MHDRIYKQSNLFTWYLLALQAGFINVGGILSVHRFVSHVTGFASYAGIELSKYNFFSAFSMILVPIAFLFGSAISGFFIERHRENNQSPNYFLVLSLMSIIYLTIALFGSSGFFGTFGEELLGPRDYALLISLCLSCGIQNAVVTSWSGAVVRTTHLTGITTDLGIGIIKFFNLKNQHQKNLEGRANKLRMGIIFSFIVGSFFGALVYNQFLFKAFFIPAVLSFGIALKLRETNTNKSSTTSL